MRQNSELFCPNAHSKFWSHSLNTGSIHVQLTVLPLLVFLFTMSQFVPVVHLKIFSTQTKLLQQQKRNYQHIMENLQNIHLISSMVISVLVSLESNPQWAKYRCFLLLLINFKSYFIYDGFFITVLYRNNNI